MGLEKIIRKAAIGLIAGTMLFAGDAEAKTRVDTRYAIADSKVRDRKSTDLIVLHTTEAPSHCVTRIKAKKLANYVVDTDGTIYPIVHHGDVANHAGRSLWNGRTNLSESSIGIEVVGYHYAPLTSSQESALKSLVSDLERTYGLGDSDVLGHYQIAANKNKWSRGKLMRGRRKDGVNIRWDRIGVQHRTDDPDYVRGRVTYDQALIAAMQRNGVMPGRGGKARVTTAAGKVRDVSSNPIEYAAQVYDTKSNVIENGKTPWTLAGEKHDDEDTFYVFPDKRIVAGDRIKDREWDRIPAGTRVYTDTTLDVVMRTANPLITLGKGEYVWSKVQGAYDDHDTCYILPDGQMVRGDKADFNRIGAGTRIVLDCDRAYTLGGKMTPFAAAGKAYRTEKSIYVFPGGDVKDGTQVKDYTRLPKGTMLLKRN